LTSIGSILTVSLTLAECILFRAVQFYRGDDREKRRKKQTSNNEHSITNIQKIRKGGDEKGHHFMLELIITKKVGK
jgi:hypothetical protein